MNEKDLFSENLDGKVLGLLKYDLKLGKEVFKQMEDYNYHMYKVEYHPWSQHCKGTEHRSITVQSFKDQVYIEST